MTIKKLIFVIALVIIGSFGACRDAQAQTAPNYWTLHEPDKVACPGITVMVTRSGNALLGTATNSIAGASSKITGSINRSNAFVIKLTPTTSGGPVGTITGTLNTSAGIIKASLKGSGCTDGTVTFEYGTLP